MHANSGLKIALALTTLAILGMLASTQLVAAGAVDAPADAGRRLALSTVQERGSAMSLIASMSAAKSAKAAVSADIAVGEGLLASLPFAAVEAQGNLSLPFVLLLLGASGLLGTIALVWCRGVV